MDFGFLPHQLNTDIIDFRGNVEYISSDNSVDLYRAKNCLLKLLLGFPTYMSNLYFFEGSLITVYCHLEYFDSSYKMLKKKIDFKLKLKGSPFSENQNSGFLWKSDFLVLAIVKHKGSSKMYLYYSLLKYSVY